MGCCDSSAHVRWRPSLSGAIVTQLVTRLHAQLIRKSVSYRARGSTRRSVERSRVRVELWLCCGFEGDRVAEGFELADVVAHAAVRVGAGGVEI